MYLFFCYMYLSRQCHMCLLGNILISFRRLTDSSRSPDTIRGIFTSIVPLIYVRHRNHYRMQHFSAESTFKPLEQSARISIRLRELSGVQTDATSSYLLYEVPSVRVKAAKADIYLTVVIDLPLYY